jgi:predicted phage baseplate assembly protein
LVLLEGALVSEAGTVETTDVSKTIVLNASPVVEKSVSIFLTPPNSTGQAWNEIDSLFFTSGSTDQVFEVIKTENYGATLLFGDGISGKPVATNTDYFITYRVGGGSRGNILSDVINVPISGEDDDSNAKSGILENTSVAVGGRDAEDVEKAKRYAPLVFRSQNRLVTINDYSNFANQYANSVGATGKARAVVRDAYSSANIIDIYLLQVASNIQLQQATVEYKKQLLEAIQDKKMITDEVVIVDGVVRTLDLVMTVRIDKYLLPREEQIKAKVRDRLLRFFNVDNFDFGKPLNISELNRAVFTLPEVRYATVDNLDSDVVVDFNEIIQLNNFTINIVGV